MKKIGIDVRLYRQTGVGTYLRNYLYCLFEKKSTHFSYHLFALPRDISEIRTKYPDVHIHEAPYLWHSFGEQVGYYFQLERCNLDLMHFTYFGYPILYKRPFITTIHDMTPLFFKTGKASTQSGLVYELKHRAFQYILRSQVANSLAIITPTHAVRKQLLSYYGKQYGSKIVSLYEGVGYELVQSIPNIKLETLFPFPFYIYVGNFYPHKNLDILIEAFSQVKSAYKLILIGPDDYFAKSLKKNVRSKSQNILFYHNPTHEDLVFFYTRAKALIHPSLSEGFGLPLVEAAHFNCPIIASNIEVFQELLEDTYMSFNPRSAVQISRAIISFESQKNPKPDYSKILKRYSFNSMTRQTEKIYESILT